MSTQNTRLGIWLMSATAFVFAVQDGISRHLAGEYNVYMVVMIRYWFFASFVVALSMRAKGGLRQAVQTKRPVLQITRGALLAAEICVMVSAFVLLGLVESHAIFAAYPLIVAALSGPMLGETVGWRRWIAIGIGFIGVLIILQPGIGVLSPFAFIPVASAVMFATYNLLTRLAAQSDTPQTSFFYTGVVGALVMTPIGLLQWEIMVGSDWLWMGALCLTGATGHWLLIKTYDVSEASAVQPFAYLQLVFGAFFGITIFAETLSWNIALGACVVVAAGIFTLVREART